MRPGCLGGSIGSDRVPVPVTALSDKLRRIADGSEESLSTQDLLEIANALDTLEFMLQRAYEEPDFWEREDDEW